ncbi:MAG: acyl-CoA dehydrogenase [Hyphomicrobiaceae bacterium]|nr:acyl-CoA dehydrogenase [Hyphomicrobiaceae bacterium]
MDFELTPEQRMFRDSVRNFADRTLPAGAVSRAHQQGFPWDVARLLAAQGLIGIGFAEEKGGLGGTLMDAILAIEQIALVCPRSSDLVHAYNFGAIRTFVEYASPAQRERYLPKLLKGEALMAVAMTEPEAGSAVTDLTTAATPKDDGYLINGTKCFTTNSLEADLYLVYVRFGPGVGGIGSIILERDTPGFTFGQPSGFMGGDPWRQLYFEDCYIGRENVLLGPGGFKKQISGFNVERLGNSARALAIGRYAFNCAREHALVRKQFGRALCEFQGLQWKFADMALQLDAAQLLLYRAVVNAEGSLPSAYDTVMAKLACNKAGFEVANEALQIMGGSGYSTEVLVEYCVRRTRGWMIAGGSTEMMKNRIAELIFDRHFSQRPEKRS